MARGPVEVRAACESALAEIAGAVPTSAVTGSREEWAAALGATQRVIDVASAVQDAAIVRLAAIEPEWLDDGTEVESHRALGHAALDAPAIVSGVLSTSAHHAANRVRTALHLAADGPVGSDTETGLGALHAAMAAGRLDGYRAGVVADELEHAPAQVRASVVAALDAHLDTEDAAHLRRRCRRVLARISPGLLRQRAARARAESGLRRWADEPGVDHWDGTFPSEEAASAWAAIDALARQYVADGVCVGIERARAKALTDLVAGHATVTTVLTVTVPAAALPDTGATHQPEVSRPAVRPGALLDPGARGQRHVGADGPDRGRPGPAGAPDVPDPQSNALVSEGCPAFLTGVESGSEARRAASDSFDDSDSRPAGAFGAVASGPQSRIEPASGSVAETGGSGSASAGTVIGDDDLVEVTGPSAGQPVMVSRQWLADTAQTSTTQVAPCDPISGALVDPDDVPGADPPWRAGPGAYRPPASMARRVRARDRRCRFPGCAVAAVFCDLDHARPWPHGPTADTNLLCLCRRHHRIKHRPGWRLTLRPDGTASWTDPTGRVRTTAPVDALTATVLLGPRDVDALEPEPEVSTSKARTVLSDGPHTELEFLLEHLIAPARDQHGMPGSGRRPLTTWHDSSGRRGRVEVSQRPRVLVLDRTGACRRRPGSGRRDEPDLPPF